MFEFSLPVEMKHFVSLTTLNPSQHAQRRPLGIGTQMCSHPPLRWPHAWSFLSTGDPNICNILGGETSLG